MTSRIALHSGTFPWRLVSWQWPQFAMIRGSCPHCSYIFLRTHGWRRDRGIALLIRNCDTRWICVVRFTSRPLYPQRKNLGYSLNIRQGDQKRASGHFGEDTNLKSNTGYTSAYSHYSEWSIPAHHILYPRHFNRVVVGLMISFCPHTLVTSENTSLSLRWKSSW